MRDRNGIKRLMVFVGTMAAGGMAATAQVDLAALSQETQRVAHGPNSVTMAWWMPEEFWAATFAASPSASGAQTEGTMKAIRRYTVVAVVGGTTGTSGAMSYRSGDELREITRLTDAWGKTYPPLDEKAIDPEMKSMIEALMPSIGNSLGPLGQNLHFLLFPARNEDGDRIADARAKGRFSVKVGKTELKWRLPVDALLPAKNCGECKQACKGSWSFCPWCGTKLEEK